MNLGRVDYGSKPVQKLLPNPQKYATLNLRLEWTKVPSVGNSTLLNINIGA